MEALPLKQVQAFGQRSGSSGMASAERVAQRLNGPLHRPAVLEALGCLIPRAFHPRQDGKSPPGKAVREPGMSVHLQAGSWKIDAFEEQALVGMSPGAEARLLKETFHMASKLYESFRREPGCRFTACSE